MSRNPDTTKLVEHLRTIHFTLIVACLGLLAVSTINPINDTKRAYDDIVVMNELSDSWNPRWLAEYVDNEVTQFKDRNDNNLNAIDTVYVLEPIEGVQYGAWLSEYHTPPICDPPEWTVFGDKIEDNRVGVPLRLADFRHLWEELGRRNKIYAFTGHSDAVLIVDPAEVKPARLEVSSACPEIPVSVSLGVSSEAQYVRARLAPAFDIFMQSELWPQGATHLLIAGDHPSDRDRIDENSLIGPNGKQIVIPLFTHVIDIDPRKELASIAEVNWDTDNFDRSFEELASLTKNIEGSSLNNLQDHFKSELKRTGDQFEIFGVSIPASALSLWGIIILIGIQLYFFLHLHTFISRIGVNDPGMLVPWLGIYDNYFARTIFVLSVSLLPVGVCIYLSYSETSNGWSTIDWVRLILFTTLSILFAYITLILVIKLWEKQKYNRGDEESTPQSSDSNEDNEIA